MRAREFLLEYNQAITAQRYGAKVLQRMAQDRRMPNQLIAALTPEQRTNIINHILGHLEAADPTPRKEYMPWIVKIYSEGGKGSDIEDMASTTRDALAKFHELKTRRRLPTEVSRDIMQFRSVSDFLDTVDMLPDPAELDQPENRGRAQEIIRTDAVRVIVPEDEAAACYYGRGTRWCTAASGNNYFDSYNQEGPLYIFLPQQPKYPGEKYQMSIAANQTTNEKDQPVDPWWVVSERFGDLRPQLEPYIKDINDLVMFTPPNVVNPVLHVMAKILRKKTLTMQNYFSSKNDFDNWLQALDPIWNLEGLTPYRPLDSYFYAGLKMENLPNVLVDAVAAENVRYIQYISRLHKSFAGLDHAELFALSNELVRVGNHLTNWIEKHMIVERKDDSWQVRVVDTEILDESPSKNAVTTLKTALEKNKQSLKKMSKQQVYDRIDQIMTRIAKNHNITGQELHDLWVKRYGKIPDTWILDEMGVPPVSPVFPMRRELPKRPPNWPDPKKKISENLTAESAQELWNKNYGEEMAWRVFYNIKDELLFSVNDLCSIRVSACDTKDRLVAMSKIEFARWVLTYFTDALEQNGWPEAHSEGIAEVIKTKVRQPLLNKQSLLEFAQQLDENFADGKVKGKSRPGRVKKAGASCAGSVTDLRAKAKKYGGERGKMYHWCANMKSGKNK